MAVLLRNRISVVWFMLIAATFVSWWLGVDHGSTAATLAVMGVAFTKVRFVGMYFMELRHAPLLLNLLFHAWCVVVFGVVIGIYLSGV